MVIQDIIDIIQEQTRDDSVTWTDSDIIGYVNEAVKNTIQRAPEANSKKEFIPSIKGIEQSLPQNGVKIINVIANATVNNILGDIIYKTDVVDKDAYNPTWRSSRAKPSAVEWMERSEPTKFLVWPPISAIATLYVEYSFYPADLTLATETVMVTNEFIEAVRLWCFYRTYSRDSEDTPSVKRAVDYKLEFETFFK